jgi:hypothetical protein
MLFFKIYLYLLTDKGAFCMIHKFFTLRIVHPSGITERATWKQRFQWLFGGCHLRDERVVSRYCQMKRNQEHQS